MKTLATTFPPALTFKQLSEPYKDKYTSKQERLASQVRDILNSQNPQSKNPETFLNSFENELGLDLLILPSKHRKKIEVYSQDKSSDYKDIIVTYSPEKKPNMQNFSDYLYYTKEEIKESNANFFAYLGLGLMAVCSLLFSNKMNSAVKIPEPIKKEIQTNVSKSVPKDTMQLSKFFIK